MTMQQLSLLSQDDLISLPLASPAKTSASPTQRDKGWKVNGLDCSMKSSESFASADPVTSYWKTAQPCLLAETGEIWEQFSGSFSSAGTMQNGKLYRRRLWVRNIYGSAYLLSPVPTPMASDAMGGGSQHPKGRTRKSGYKAQYKFRDWCRRHLGKFTPEMCEVAQGFPIGWTELNL